MRRILDPIQLNHVFAEGSIKICYWLSPMPLKKGTNKKTSKKLKIGFGALLIAILFLFFHYNLPRTSVVQIPGQIPNEWNGIEEA